MHVLKACLAEIKSKVSGTGLIATCSLCMTRTVAPLLHVQYGAIKVKNVSCVIQWGGQGAKAYVSLTLLVCTFSVRCPVICILVKVTLCANGLQKVAQDRIAPAILSSMRLSAAAALEATDPACMCRTCVSSAAGES